jgi:hypothetical protein
MHAGMHKYTHACLHTCIPTCMPTHIHTCTPTCRHTCTHTCMHTCMHTCTHTCMHTYIHTSYVHAYESCMHTYDMRLAQSRRARASRKACRGCNTPATSAPGLGSPLSASAPVLSSLTHFHICAGTGLTHPCHICAGTGLTPPLCVRRPPGASAPTTGRPSRIFGAPAVPSSTLEYPRATRGPMRAHHVALQTEPLWGHIAPTAPGANGAARNAVATRLQPGAICCNGKPASRVEPAAARACRRHLSDLLCIAPGMVSRAAWHPLRHCWR